MVTDKHKYAFFITYIEPGLDTFANVYYVLDTFGHNIRGEHESKKKAFMGLAPSVMWVRAGLETKKITARKVRGSCRKTKESHLKL